MKMEIRDYSPTDRDACIAIFDGNTPEYFDPKDRAEFEAFLDKLPGPYFTVTVSGAGVVACGGWYISETEKIAGLSWGMVRKDFQHRGAGRALLAYRLSQLKRAQPGVLVRVRTTQLVQGFFERHEFTVRKRTAGGFGPDLDFVEMVRAL